MNNHISLKSDRLKRTSKSEPPDNVVGISTTSKVASADTNRVLWLSRGFFIQFCFEQQNIWKAGKIRYR